MDRVVVVVVFVLFVTAGFSNKVSGDSRLYDKAPLPYSSVGRDVSETQTNAAEIPFEEMIRRVEEDQFRTNFLILGTNFLSPLNIHQRKSLRVYFEFEKSVSLREEPFFMDYARRYEIIFLVSIPTTYMVTKFLMEQVSFYNYKDPMRNLNTQQWAFIIASSIIIPFIVAVEDYLSYKEFVEKRLRF